MTKSLGPRRRSIRVDLSDWGMGDWPNEIAKAITIDRSNDGACFEIALTADQFEAATRKIAKEAIVEYLRDCILLLGTEGIEILFCDDYAPRFYIPWDEVQVDEDRPPALETIRQRIVKETGGVQ